MPLNIEARAPGAIMYPADLTTPPHEKWILFEAKAGRHIARSGFIEGGTEDGEPDATLASVALYLPTDALKSAMSVGYKNIELGMAAGKAIEAATQKEGSMRAPTQGGGTSTIGNLLKGAGGFAAAAVTQKALDWTSGIAGKVIDDPKGALEVVAGGRINPRTDTAFDAMQYRTHEFSFNLIPRTKEEADNIDAILNILHYYSLPSYGDAANLGNFMIGYPYEFVITMFAETHLNKIERSVLTGLSVDHAGGDRIAFVGDYYPAATTLTLSFQEVRLLGRDSIDIILRGGGVGIGEDPRGATDPFSTVTLPDEPGHEPETTIENGAPPKTPIHRGDNR